MPLATQEPPTKSELKAKPVAARVAACIGVSAAFGAVLVYLALGYAIRSGDSVAILGMVPQVLAGIAIVSGYISAMMFGDDASFWDEGS